MKQISYLLVALNLIFSVNLWSQERKVIKVACLGNSITYGSGIEDNIKDAWPPQLGRMLGEGYEVRNFGYSGRTLLQKGNHPYMQTQLFYDAIGWNPDIVIIMLGMGDLFPDAIQPDAVASGEMARIIYKYLTGNECVKQL